MKSKQIEELKEEHRIKTILVFKVLNQLEQRIATIEKSLASHAKTIGQLREDKKYELEHSYN